MEKLFVHSILWNCTLSGPSNDNGGFDTLPLVCWKEGGWVGGEEPSRFSTHYVLFFCHVISEDLQNFEA